MALCTSPALIDDWAAESLLLNALETPTKWRHHNLQRQSSYPSADSLTEWRFGRAEPSMKLTGLVKPEVRVYCESDYVVHLRPPYLISGPNL